MISDYLIVDILTYGGAEPIIQMCYNYPQALNRCEFSFTQLLAIQQIYDQCADFMIMFKSAQRIHWIRERDTCERNT